MVGSHLNCVNPLLLVRTPVRGHTFVQYPAVFRAKEGKVAVPEAEEDFSFDGEEEEEEEPELKVKRNYVIKNPF